MLNLKPKATSPGIEAEGSYSDFVGIVQRYESKLLVSPSIYPRVVPYIIPSIPPFKEFRLWLIWDYT